LTTEPSRNATNDARIATTITSVVEDRLAGAVLMKRR
jgi:hypothetical protein